jgi:hydrogenase expression/formation protein HypE
MDDQTPSLQGAAQGATCPLPLPHNDRIVMGHGSGGKMTHDLIKNVILPAFKSTTPYLGDDGAVIYLPDLPTPPQRIVISTDSHVVTPLFFPGGDIGRLAVCGTVNDVAMMGATPLYMTAGFILEEGLEISILIQIARSMQSAAEEAGIRIVAGDTKVVQKGRADGLYINTAGFGVLYDMQEINGSCARPGDKIILSGTIGDHGIAVLSARGELGFAADIKSDVAPLNHLVGTMLSASRQIHVLRDPTRGGLATTLNEIAQQSQVSITINETAIPIHSAVQSACEMFGFDPLYIANEGKLIAFVSAIEANKILDAMHSTIYGKEAVIIGEVVNEKAPGRVLLRTSIGTHRVIDVLSGEMLPRIC